MVHPWSLARVAATDDSWLQTLLRVSLGGVLLPHGAQHLLGLFGGYGFSGTLEWMTATLGFPTALATVGIVTEFAAPLLMIVGFGTRLAAAALAVFLAFAASTHVGNGFFMNWFGTMPAGIEGFEYHLLAIVIAIVVAFRGAGAWSVDRVLSTRRR
jgi:putative oxidoreductase